MMLWQVGHMVSGPPSLESSKALSTPPHPPQRPKWATALAVGPAQIDTASLPRTGHQLYLPQQGSALPPQPSTICPLNSSGASPIRATLSPQPLAPTQVTGPGRSLLPGKGWMLPYAPSLLPPPKLTHTGTPPPHTWSACFLATCRERARPTP